MAHFSWHPVSYDVAKMHVDLARSGTPPVGPTLAQTMPPAIRELGALKCPAPPEDAEGTYRVGLDLDGLPEIQRLGGDGVWHPVL